MGFAKRRDLIGGSIPTRDTIIPEGLEVLTERHKLQVSERLVHFDVLAFLYKIKSVVFLVYHALIIYID